MQAEVDAGKWKEPVDQGLDAAHELGVSAVPTFLIADRFAISGAQDANVFRQAFQRVLARTSIYYGRRNCQLDCSVACRSTMPKVRCTLAGAVDGRGGLAGHPGLYLHAAFGSGVRPA